MNKQLANFMDFVREQGVVGLAVGLAIGTQVTTTVQSIVDGFINPIVGWILGSDSEGLANATLELSDSASRPLVIGWGLIVSSLIQLLAVAFVIYFIVKKLKLDKLDKKAKD